MYKVTAEKRLSKTELFRCSEIKRSMTQPVTGVGWWISALELYLVGS